MIRKAWASLAATAALSSAVVALAWGWADLGTVSPRLQMDDWRATGRVPSADAWMHAHRRLQRARAIQPLNAAYSMDLARLHDWMVWHSPPNGRQAAAFRDQATRYYLEVVSERPTWGLAWASLAGALALRGSNDPRLYTALGQAARLAPGQPEVQYRVAWLGLAMWDRLPEEIKQRVLGVMRHAIAIDERVDRLIALAVQFGRDEAIRPLLATPEQRRMLDQALRKRRDG